jgi:glycosyltransferase involved in cell wall biosynthesis
LATAGGKLIRVTALTSGWRVPSSRFRVRQFVEPLARLGVEVSERWPRVNKYALKRAGPLGALARLNGVLAARRSEVTWLERELVAGRRTIERFAGRRRLFDVDDALWLLGRADFSERIAAESFGVIAGNELIAEHYRRHCGRVWVVPTSVETRAWKPPLKREPGPWTVGWMGTSSNLPNLLAIEEPLAEFFARHDDARLLVVCDREPRLNSIPPRSRRFVRWSAENEVGSVQSMDVGLMPLPDTEWARAKCALKMLLYMSVGIPVVASPVGVGASLFEHGDVGIAAAAAASPGDWYEALRLLYEDSEAARTMGAAGRRLVEDEYSVVRNSVRLAEIFREAAAC